MKELNLRSKTKDQVLLKRSKMRPVFMKLCIKLVVRTWEFL